MTETKALGAASEARSGPDTTPNATPPKMSARKKKLLLLGAGLASLALAYGIGRLPGELALSRMAERHEADRQAFKAELALCQTDRNLLSARRSLSLVALALDRRNFGVAETHRRKALDLLAGPSLIGIPEVAALSGRVRELRLEVDPDPGTKRDEVIATTEALDGLSARAAKLAAPAASAGRP